MENKTMLERLENILKAKEENKQEMLKNLINDLILDVANEKASHNANYDIVKTINKQLQEIKKKCKSRPIFANSVIKYIQGAERLCYTDSFYLIALVNKPEFENVVNPCSEALKNYAYPNLEHLIPQWHDKTVVTFDKKQLITLDLKYRAYLKEYYNKADEDYQKKKDEMLYKLVNSYIDPNYLLKVCDLIGYENITVEYDSSNNNHIMVLKNKNNDIGMVLPIRNLI